MKPLFQSFLLLLVSSSDKELAHQVQFLKVENEILRSRLPKRIQVNAKEKNRLMKFGKGLGKAIHDLITIVTPRTFLRWVSAENDKGTAKKADESKKVGRPKKDEEIRELVLKFARENAWGYTRILGELKKLGITGICRSTVVNILKEAGFDPNPKRGEGTWSEFMTRDAKTLWACDFFQKKIWTTGGFVDYFMLFFIQVGSRRVYLAGITPNPTDAWVTQQARNMAVIFQDQANKPTHLLRDHDSKFTDRFDAIFKSEDVEVKKVGPRAPNMSCPHLDPCILTLCLSHGPRIHRGDRRFSDNRLTLRSPLAHEIPNERSRQGFCTGRVKAYILPTLPVHAFIYQIDSFQNFVLSRKLFLVSKLRIDCSQSWAAARISCGARY